MFTNTVCIIHVRKLVIFYQWLLVPGVLLSIYYMYYFVFVSIIQNLYAPDEDPEMKVFEYERTFEQNDELGINDIKTEDY